ncbi:SigE family RNA polymerase sigma factor [Flindersiella endophytica]
MIQVAAEAEPVAGNRTHVSVDEEFSAYVAAHRAALTRTAYLLTGDHHAAEDLVQVALVKVYAAWRRIRKKQAIGSYVRRVLINEHVSLWRRAWRQLERSTDQLPDTNVWPPHADTSDLEEQLWGVVQALPPRQRAVIVLRYYEDLSVAEVAELLGWPVGTVQSTNARGLAKLRKLLGEEVES